MKESSLDRADALLDAIGMGFGGEGAKKRKPPRGRAHWEPSSVKGIHWPSLEQGCFRLASNAPDVGNGRLMSKILIIV